MVLRDIIPQPSQPAEHSAGCRRVAVDGVAGGPDLERCDLCRDLWDRLGRIAAAHRAHRERLDRASRFAAWWHLGVTSDD